MMYKQIDGIAIGTIWDQHWTKYFVGYYEQRLMFHFMSWGLFSFHEEDLIAPKVNPFFITHM